MKNVLLRMGHMLRRDVKMQMLDGHHSTYLLVAQGQDYVLPLILGHICLTGHVGHQYKLLVVLHKEIDSK